MIKTKTWVILITVILLLSLAAALPLFFSGTPGTTVQILQDGNCLYEIDLGRVREPYTLTVADGRGGSNTILIEPGRIRMQEADCPDQVCVRRSWLDLQASPIVCLPHRLVIQAVGGGGLDGAAG